MIIKKYHEVGRDRFIRNNCQQCKYSIFGYLCFKEGLLGHICRMFVLPIGFKKYNPEECCDSKDIH